jgi:hypothetical protein
MMSDTLIDSSKEKKFEKLADDVIRLQESMHILHELIKEQGETVTSIEEFIHESKENVKASVHDLAEANTYSNYLTYIAGGIATVVLYIFL